MNRLLRVRAIRALEVTHQSDRGRDSLMHRAADAATRSAMDMCQGGGRVLVLAGPGNNGGDAWLVARQLQAKWYRVTVLAGSEPRAPEAAEARRQFIAAGGAVAEDWPEAEHDLIIDGLLGIGVRSLDHRPIPQNLAEWIEKANQSGLPILALDVPSGLDADTGTVTGPCIRALRTITFIADKPGLHMAAGPDHAGTVEVADLDIHPTEPAPADRNDAGWLLGHDAAPAGLPRRRRDTHKGVFGSVGVLGSAGGMNGAGLLAARAALFAGAGTVLLAPLDDTLGGVDWLHPEIMFRRPRDLVENAPPSTLVIGPGMGTSDAARSLVASALKLAVPLVVDADAINLIARGRALQSALKRRAEHDLISVLTPHPAEAARLLGVDTATVNTDRLHAAQMLARRFAAIVVLKGVGSIIAEPDGAWSINATGNPGMAAGGMGDVLAGVLGALLAQASAAASGQVAAIRLGVWAHGKAADQCVANGAGPAGLTAGEVLRACRAALNSCALPEAAPPLAADRPDR